jgi:hypothetical protein
LKGVNPEEEADNYFVESEDFTTWLQSNMTSRAKSTTVRSPRGTFATEMIANATSGTHYVGINALTYPADSAVTFSVLCKAGSKDWIALRTSSTTSGIMITYFDIATGAVGATDGHNDSGVIDCGDGWYLCYVIHQLTGGDTQLANHRIFSAEANNDSVFAGDTTTVQNYIDAAKVEALPYPTTYIPSTGSATTRNLETLEYETPAFMQATCSEYTIAGEVFVPYKPSARTDNGYILDIRLNAANRVSLYISSSGLITGYTKPSGGSSQVTAVAATEGTNHKFCLRYDGATLGLSVNGSAMTNPVLTGDLSFTTLTTFHVGADYNDSLHSNCPTKNIKIFSTALTDAQCEALTS